jgi:hypothetical protein
MVEGYTEMCCVAESDRSCKVGQCVNSTARLECDDSADCPGEHCCYTTEAPMNRIVTFCASDCGFMSGTQVCKEAGDCDNGEACHAFVCGLSDMRFALGLCTATAPEFCD